MPNSEPISKSLENIAKEGAELSVPPLWKPYLYQLQKNAPKPTPIFNPERAENIPQQYGLEFHGMIDHRKCNSIINKEGGYLVRQNEKAKGFFILSLRFSGIIKHYKLYFDGQHFVGEKKFNVLNQLVSDGLVTLFLESRASRLLHQLSSVNYNQSPYFTLTRSVRKALNRKRMVGEENSLSKIAMDSHRDRLNRTNESLSNPNISEFEAKGTILDRKHSSSTTIVKTENEISLPCQEGNDILVNPIEKCINDEIKSAGMLRSNESLHSSEEHLNDRPHRFNGQTFTGLHWCGLCGNFLWGFVLQGVKCQDCGMKCHRQCSLRVPRDCRPDLKDLQRLFGADLSTSLQVYTANRSLNSRELNKTSNDAEFTNDHCGKGSQETLLKNPMFQEDVTNLTNNLLVHPLVLSCIREIDKRGLVSEGLYRVPGSQDNIDALRLTYERDGCEVVINEVNVPDINVVAGLLKLYFRLLPLPLITIECFHKLQEANSHVVRESQISCMRDGLQLLPLAHLDTLKCFIQHLSRVCDNSNFNKMTATSLSTIFAPTLVQSECNIEVIDGICPEQLLDIRITEQESRIIEALIISQRELFN